MTPFSSNRSISAILVALVFALEGSNGERRENKKSTESAFPLDGAVN